MIEILPTPLTKEETYKLFEEYQKGNKNAEEELIMHNMRLVINIANKNSLFGSELNKELIGAGTIGLINAIRNFNINSKNEFSTYAFPWIQNAIRNELGKETKNSGLTSLDISIKNEDENTETALINLIKSEEPLTEEIIIEKIDNPKMLELIKKVFPKISEKRQKIILLYYGFYKDKCFTQQEISNMLGIPRTSVKFHLKKGLERLRKEIEQEQQKEKINKLQKK